VQCSFEIETRNAEVEAGEMNRSEEPAIDPGAGLRTRIVGVGDLGAAAFGNISVSAGA
jgi:hypothetical protein